MTPDRPGRHGLLDSEWSPLEWKDIDTLEYDARGRLLARADILLTRAIAELRTSRRRAASGATDRDATATTLSDVTAERDQYRRDFEAMSTRAQELARRVSELEVRKQELLALTVRLTNEVPFPDEIKGWTEQRARLVAEVGTLRSTATELEKERDAYRAMLCDLLASAHPHPVQHPAMSKQWARARRLLKNGPQP